MGYGRDVGPSSQLRVAGHSASTRMTLAGISRLQRHFGKLLGYLGRSQGALTHCGVALARSGDFDGRRDSAVNEVMPKRMNKKQMRWNKATVRPFLNVRTAVLDATVESIFRRHHLGFRPTNDDQ
jgi:hypothetical protein